MVGSQIFLIDTFTSSPLKGNPAIVFLLDKEKDQECLQSIAKEFNLWTCYLTKVTKLEESNIPMYNLRWFGTTSEVNICAHGTLASAHVLFSTEMIQGNEVGFLTKSGVLKAKRILEEHNNGESISESQHKNKFQVQLCFPLYRAVQLDSSEMINVPSSLQNSSMLNCVKMSEANDLIVELKSSKEVKEFNPEMEDIMKWPGRAVAITGISPPLSDFDFFTRLFAPNVGFLEDHVCGSIHCALGPYWSKKLGKKDLKAYMASSRGGVLMLRVDENAQRVFISGEATTVMKGLFVADVCNSN